MFNCIYLSFPHFMLFYGVVGDGGVESGGKPHPPFLFQFRNFYQSLFFPPTPKKKGSYTNFKNLACQERKLQRGNYVQRESFY